MPYEGKRFKRSADAEGVYGASGPARGAHRSGSDAAGERVTTGAAPAPTAHHRAAHGRQDTAAHAGGHFARGAAAAGTTSAPQRRASRTGAAGIEVPEPVGSRHRAHGQASARPRQAAAAAPASARAQASEIRSPRPARSGARQTDRSRRTRTAGGPGGGGPRGPRSARRGDKPQDGRSKRTIVSYVLIGVGILLLLVAAGIFIWAQLGYRQAAEAYDNLAQYVTVDDTAGSGIPHVDWDALKAQNEDIVAWIYVPGTEISYPVVQGEDNEEYLRRLPDGTSNSSGSIILDCDQTAPGMVDQQTTVYGHHMNDGSMFNSIEKALDQERFDAITVVYYLTPETTYTMKPLFVARVEDTYVDARQANFESTEALQAYLTDLRSYAQSEAGDVDARLAETDQVLALVTCSGMAPADHRAVMICTIESETPVASVES